MPKKVTTENFIEKAKQIHGNKYDYSKVKYVKATKEVCIICPIHGEFWQKPVKHLIGHGCMECGKNKISETMSLTIDAFITKAKKIHGNKYDYSKIDLKHRNKNGEVCIICPIHGEFWQKPSSHLYGLGCKKCAIEKTASLQRKTTEQFIKEAKKIHGNKYDYSKVEYKGVFVNVCIICPIHGEFWQTPDAHLHGHGCKFCLYDTLKNCRRSNKDEFVNKAKEIHGNKYNYSKVEYINCDTLVTIICPKHGEFKQTPYNHLHGCSCPCCRNWKLEEDITSFLEKNGVPFERQKKFDWLGRQSLDVYIPNANIGIECQGMQHFKPINYFGGIKGFENRIRLDKLKKELCDINGIKLLYYSNKKINDSIITNKEKILEQIKRDTTE